MSILTRALIAFDERRENPTVNLGTLGAAGNVAYTGTVRLAPSPVAHIWRPHGVTAGSIVTSTPSTVLAGATVASVRFVVAADDYTTAANQHVVALGVGGMAGAMRLLLLGGSGNVYLGIRGPSGGEVYFVAANPGWTDGADLCGWALWDAATGLTQFYSKPTTPNSYLADMNSDDDWVPLGLPQAAVGGPSPPSIVATPYLAGFGGIGATSGGSQDFGGKFRAASISASASGPAPLIVDAGVLTDEGATSFEARTGQTVIINRSTGAT